MKQLQESLGLSGRAAIVTGGAKGIGKAIAHRNGIAHTLYRFFPSA